MLDLLECTSLKYRQALRLLRVQPWPVGMLQLLYLVGEHLTDSRFKVQYLLCTSTHAQKIYRNYAVLPISLPFEHCVLRELMRKMIRAKQMTAQFQRVAVCRCRFAAFFLRKPSRINREVRINSRNTQCSNGSEIGSSWNRGLQIQ